MLSWKSFARTAGSHQGKGWGGELQPAFKYSYQVVCVPWDHHAEKAQAWSTCCSH